MNTKHHPSAGYPDPASIGARLQEVFASSSISSLAASLGVGTRTIRKYMRGSSMPPLEFLLSIALEFNISLEWLLLGRGTMRIEDQTPALLQSASIVELARAIEVKLSAMTGAASQPCPNPECPLAEGFAEAKPVQVVVDPPQSPPETRVQRHLRQITTRPPG